MPLPNARRHCWNRHSETIHLLRGCRVAIARAARVRVEINRPLEAVQQLEYDAEGG